jgi:hypothetical protein
MIIEETFLKNGLVAAKCVLVIFRCNKDILISGSIIQENAKEGTK